MRKLIPLWGALAAMLLCQAALAEKKDKSDLNTRSVEGSVSDAAGTAVAGAVVKLENTKTLQVRSFITRDDGTFAFHGLSPDVEYELYAEHQNSVSDTKKISVFETRKKVVFYLKLTKTKK